ncbi:alkaline phosphatase family protein [candidate division KSB1 bacterium]|nr:alkaline phosphatase family protein [candidate division KSB1 bacterium]
MNRTISAGAFAAATLSAGGLSAFPNIKNNKISNRVIVLGIDGMDPVLLKKFVSRGEMPYFAKLMNSGYMGPLGTTMPPQSPVAWSSFITGTNPGGNGIFDFIHRDAEHFVPYLSTSRSYDAAKTLDVGKYAIPLKGGRVELLRRGPAFWTTLEENGISASLYKLPANFPVEKSRSRMISGMGTPDLLGGYGTFTFYTDTHVPGAENFTGGRVVNVDLDQHRVITKLYGPQNSLRTDKQDTHIDLEIFRDPWQPVARIRLQDKEIVLKQGEFSDWVPIKFELIPMFAGISGMVRFYMQEVHPYFRLYVSPINVDPMDPTLPISNPSSYSKELSQAIGRFYTQGFPEDTKALSNGIFSNEDFLKQSKMVLEERLKAFDHEFSRFQDGFFFFYFSSIDQNTHMMWRNMDPSHPLYEPKASQDAKEAIYFFYKKMDDVLKQTLAKVDDRTTLMIMSDHGFAPFGREFHLSTWLVENGFTAVKDPDRYHEGEFFSQVDWKNTKAYAMGLNGIYVNVRGREANGSVLLRDKKSIKKEIQEKLVNVKDPKTGKRMLTNVYDSQEIYSGPYMSLAPDLVVGYQRGYRISDEAVLGKFPIGMVGDRTDKWAADHCMDPAIVPGVLIANRPVVSENPALMDLAPSIIKAFGLPVPMEMEGKSVFG